MSELWELGLAEAAERIQKREISPVDLTEACLARAEALDPHLNCFITRTAVAAREQARQAEAELAAGRSRGRLTGIPIALKDIIDTAGIRTTLGTRIFSGRVPAADAFLVSRLREAGAVMLGKLNMHEIALGVTSINPHYGACLNPWAPERISGGSSGGCAVALAAGLAFGAVGTDTGGSIRIPASLCGVVGLKPTRGLLSLRGVAPLSWNLDCPGPMARRVRDAALLLQALFGFDPEDPVSVDRPGADFVSSIDAGVAGWPIAVARDDFYGEADPEVTAAVGEAAGVFASLGARVEEIQVPGAREAAQANALMVVCDAAAVYRDRLHEDASLFGADVRQRLWIGLDTPLPDYIAARRTQELHRQALAAIFRRFRLLLTPATPVAAPLRAGTDAIEQSRHLTRFTSPFNLTGLPALAVPGGFNRLGLPLGLQLCGPAWAEADLLQAGQAYETAAGWPARRPGLGLPPQSDSIHE